MPGEWIGLFRETLSTESTQSRAQKAKRRYHEDIIETYKYMQGAYNVKKPCFEKNEREFHDTRGHSYSLKMHKHKSGKQHSYRSHFLTERVFNEWNDLPENVVSAPSVNSFKARLDKHWLNREDKFNPNCLR